MLAITVRPSHLSIPPAATKLAEDHVELHVPKNNCLVLPLQWINPKGISLVGHRHMHAVNPG